MLLKTFCFCFLGTCCTYAWALGGRDERLGVLIVLGATVFSLDPVLGGVDWSRHDVDLAIVDILTFLAAATLALFSTRFWPLWMAGFCCVGAAVNIAVAMSPGLAPKVYAYTEGFWAYPAIAAIAIGAFGRRQASMRTLPHRPKTVD